MQEDWDIPEGLTPFYGDWHNLLCLNEATGTVVYLNDLRELLFTWPSCNDFIAALIWVEEEPIDQQQIPEGELWLDF